MQTSNTPLKTVDGLFLLGDYQPSDRSLLSNYDVYTSEQFKTVSTVLDLSNELKRTLNALCSCASFRKPVEHANYPIVKELIAAGNTRFYLSNGEYYEQVTEPSATRSLAAIAEMAKLSVRTISRHVNYFEELGIIKREHNYAFVSRCTSKRTASTYTFVLSEIDNLIYNFKQAFNTKLLKKRLELHKYLSAVKKRGVKVHKKGQIARDKIISGLKKAYEAIKQTKTTVKPVKKAVVSDPKSVKTTSDTTEAIFTRFEAIELYSDIKTKGDCFDRRSDIALRTGISCLFNAGDKMVIPNVNTTGLFYVGSGSKLKPIGYVKNSHGHIYVLEQVIKELRTASDKGTDSNKKAIELLTNELDTAMRYAGGVSSALKGC
ncbi:hypothetical protein I3271_05315 [Photobacterium leiognathi]|uniref:hypothetical protein n=1 Tax=Photobacterium leiognathi TaxID=553611 RepID=UPI001EDF7357|nr:hypothetical protein [Photobacterium leiognathi]MCG3884099.1 hypothetical protein [Photobacterium leiognathi]